MDQLTGEYKKPCLSPPTLPPSLFLHVTGPGCGSPLAGGLRSQTCSPGWLASLIKEDRFLASLSLPLSLSLPFFFFFFSFLGSCWGKWSQSCGGRGRTRKGARDYGRLMRFAPSVQDALSLHGAVPCSLQATSWGCEKRGLGSPCPQSWERPQHSQPLWGRSRMADWQEHPPCRQHRLADSFPTGPAGPGQRACPLPWHRGGRGCSHAWCWAHGVECAVQACGAAMCGAARVVWC